MSYIPNNVYEAEIESQLFGETKDKGTPFFEVEARITGVMNPANHNVEPCPSVGEWNPRITVFLTEATLKPDGIGTRALRLLGMTGDFSDYDPDRSDHTPLTGRKVFLKYKGKKAGGNGKEYDNWDLFDPEHKPKRDNKPGAAKRLDNLFKGVLGGKPKPKEAPQVDEESVPF